MVEKKAVKKIKLVVRKVLPVLPIKRPNKEAEKKDNKGKNTINKYINTNNTSWYAPRPFFKASIPQPPSLIIPLISPCFRLFEGKSRKQKKKRKGMGLSLVLASMRLRTEEEAYLTQNKIYYYSLSLIKKEKKLNK
jgi:hypothetical protein